MVQMHQDGASDETSRLLGIETEFELGVKVNVGDSSTLWPEGLIASNRELELDK